MENQFETCIKLMKNYPTKEILERFFSRVKINNETDCWEWINPRPSGYGRFKIKNKEFPSHRIMYSWFYGEVYKGSHIDHRICNNPPCVNPSHLLETTPYGNLFREGSKSLGYLNSIKTHCSKWHELSLDNLLPYPLKEGHRSCRICSLEYNRKYHNEKYNERADKEGRKRLGPSKLRIQCPKGHELSGDNLDPWYLRVKGYRACLSCIKEREQLRRDKRRKNLVKLN